MIGGEREEIHGLRPDQDSKDNLEVVGMDGTATCPPLPQLSLNTTTATPATGQLQDSVKCATGTSSQMLGAPQALGAPGMKDWQGQGMVLRSSKLARVAAAMRRCDRTTDVPLHRRAEKVLRVLGWDLQPDFEDLQEHELVAPGYLTGILDIIDSKAGVREDEASKAVVGET